MQSQQTTEPAQADSNGCADELTRLRSEIDAVDAKIVTLLAERARLARAVGKAKAQIAASGTTGDAPKSSNIYRPERERAVIERAIVKGAQCDSLISSESLAAIYGEIISACRAVEARPSVAYLGPQGTFTEMAVLEQFGSSVDLNPCQTIDATFHAVESGTVQFAVVPVENSTQGTVTRTMDLLLATPLTVIGEVSVAVRHNLMNQSGSIADVEEVCAHPQALAQCRNWLTAHLPNVRITSASSNAEAAVMASKNPKLAAIAATRAADLYGLSILAPAIQDNPCNTTRFWVLGTQPAGRAAGIAAKTAVIFSVPNRAGSLFEVLEPLERHGVSMARLESRPARNGAWDYNFYVDLEGHREDEAVARALAEMRAKTSYFKVLGSFPADASGPGKRKQA